MIQDKALAVDLANLLDASLVGRLPERAALLEAIQRLNSLQRAVVSFLPPYIAEDVDLLAHKNYANMRSGVFLFADVSGFTALSEQLQAHSGAEGTEKLTTVINHYFSKMLEVLANSDGQLLKFAGDAMLAFWVGGSERETLTASRKAIRTGLRMQRAMRENFQPIRHEDVLEVFGHGHQSQLTMSIGIARGKLLEALVGNDKQRDHIIMGQLPGDAMEAEGVGVRDEVIVSADLAVAVKNEFPTQTELEDGYVQLVDDFGERLDSYELEMPVRRRAKTTAMFDFEEANLMDQLQTVVDKLKTVKVYVPPAVLRELVLSDDYHLTSENRLTVTMFIHCTGFAEMLQDWGEEYLSLVMSLLNRYYNMMLDRVIANGGTLARTDPYKLGTKLLITFGAPITHTDDPERAVGTALEMNKALEQFNARISEELPAHLRRSVYIMHRIGITQGETYAGEVGWKQRREFTVMGDDVNLSARLMAKADFGQVLMSSHVYDRVHQSYESTPLEPLNLKGKRSPVQVYSVLRELSPTSGREIAKDMPFVGHDMFMLSLSMTLKQAKMGRRRAVALVGDAGIGKTRIANQLADMAENAGFHVAWATSRERHEGKATWRTLIAELLGTKTDNRQQGLERLEGQLNELGLAILYPTFSNLLFGLTDVTNPQTPWPPPAPEVPAKDQRVTDMFKMFQQMSPEERKTSGMFGLARRITESKPILATPTGKKELSGVWKQAEKRTSLKEALVQFLQTFTQKQPVLLVIDDIHYEKPQAIELLKYVLAHVTQAKLVIVVTYEPTAALDLDIQKLDVPDLNADETNLVAMSILHATELGKRLSGLLWERTSGRPLFIDSLLRTLLDGGYIEDINGRSELKADADLDALPENVRELVISRIDVLPAYLKQVLDAAAILGEDFTAEALVFVSGVSNTDVVDSALSDLEKMQILTEHENGRYGFRHGMTQAVIYETFSRAQRVKLHHAAANYWARQRDDKAQPITQAYHLIKCGLLPDAMTTITTAAVDAEQKQDIEGAIELYTHALSIFPDEKSIHLELERLRQIQIGA